MSFMNRVLWCMAYPPRKELGLRGAAGGGGGGAATTTGGGGGAWAATTGSVAYERRKADGTAVGSRNRRAAKAMVQVEVQKCDYFGLFRTCTTSTEIVYPLHLRQFLVHD